MYGLLNDVAIIHEGAAVVKSIERIFHQIEQIFLPVDDLIGVRRVGPVADHDPVEFPEIGVDLPGSVPVGLDLGQDTLDDSSSSGGQGHLVLNRVQP